MVVGDIAGGSHHTNAQYKSMGKFLKWVKEINPKQCFITQGNHDYWKWNDLFTYKQAPQNIHCLMDQSLEFDGLRVHGSPWSAPFLDWNWMKEDDRMLPHWENIDNRTDILISHGPAYRMCDKVLEPNHNYTCTPGHLGFKSLRAYLETMNLKRVFTGHIHSAEHKDQRISPEHETIFNCVSLLDEEYNVSYSPNIFEI